MRQYLRIETPLAVCCDSYGWLGFGLEHFGRLVGNVLRRGETKKLDNISTPINTKQLRYDTDLTKGSALLRGARHDVVESFRLEWT